MSIVNYNTELVAEFLHCDKCNTQMKLDRFLFEGEKEDMKMSYVYICDKCGKQEIHNDSFPRIKVLVNNELYKYL